MKGISKVTLLVLLFMGGALLASSAQDQATVPSEKAQAPTQEEQQKDEGSVQYHSGTRFHLGGISIGGFYSHFSGPEYYGWPYGYPYAYSPFYPGFFWNPYDPFYYPANYLVFPPGANKGEVKLRAEPKTAEVYINGGYAGTADQLKSLWLEPGVYELTVKAPSFSPFSRRVYILTGKSLKIDARLEPEKAEAKP
jgi:hypothetical protein